MANAGKTKSGSAQRANKTRSDRYSRVKKSKFRAANGMLGKIIPLQASQMMSAQTKIA
jgi:hypothetical protein